MTYLQPYKLISFWEIMQEFNSGKFIHAVRAMTSLHSAAVFVENDNALVVPAKNHKEFHDYIDFLIKDLEKHGLTTALVSAKKVKELLDGAENVTVKNRKMVMWQHMEKTYLKKRCDELGSRIADELDAKKLLIISPDSIGYYEDALNKWKPVTDKHPSLIEDIDEAGKCIALGRSTAGVFHLMRIMESGVKLFGSALSISDFEEKQWNKILQDIGNEIEKRWPSHGKKLSTVEKKERQKHNEAMSYLKSVKLAWRNEVMHPKDTYTLEEAQNIYSTALAFMANLIELT